MEPIKRDETICKHWRWSLILFIIAFSLPFLLGVFLPSDEKVPESLRGLHLLLTLPSYAIPSPTFSRNMLFVSLAYVIWFSVTYYYGYLKNGTKFLLWTMLLPLPLSLIFGLVVFFEIGLAPWLSIGPLAFVAFYSFVPSLYLFLMTHLLRQENLKLKNKPLNLTH